MKTMKTCMGLLVVVLLSCCSGTQKLDPKTKDLLVKVGEDVCQEAANQQKDVDPELVELLCRAGGDTVRVLLPRTEWHAIRARASRVDAGPGK